MGIPKLVITALRGGSGKTILSIGIVAALRDRGISISPFKKGPDYIDAGWLALAAPRRISSRRARPGTGLRHT